MADRAPLGWPRLRGTVVEPHLAEWVLAAVTYYVRVNGQTLPDECKLFLKALEVESAQHRGQSPASPAPALTWLALSDAAERVGVSAEAVRKRIAAGELVAQKIGRRRYVTEASGRPLAP